MTGIRIDEVRKLFGPRDLDVTELCLEDVALSHLTRGGMRDVLCGADLVVGRGEVVVIQGQAQSGKSTLARLLEGKVVPDRGLVALNGRLQPNGFVATIAHPPAGDWSDNLDARAFLAAAYADQGFPMKAADRAAGDALHAFGLEDLAEHGPWDAMHIDRARLAVCRALVAMPVWLVFDEPELKLGRDETEALYDFVRVTCVEAHVGCVWLTRSSGVASLADRWLALREGRMVAFGEVPRRRGRLC